MTPLRRRMLEDMRLRNLSENTQKRYLDRVAAYARHFGKSPDLLGPDEVRGYQLHLIGRGLSSSTLNVTVCALRFFYRVTLQEPWEVKKIPHLKRERKLPAVNEHRVRLVRPDGIIVTFAGAGPQGVDGDGGPARAALLRDPRQLAVGPDGAVWIGSGHGLRRVHAPLPGFDATDIAIPEVDASVVYRFDSTGRHLETVHALTGATLLSFGYDTEGLLATITDGDGNVTTVERDAEGLPAAITAPFGQRTALSTNADGRLASISNPAGDTHRMLYASRGLLSGFTDPAGNRSDFQYDTAGLLTSDADAADGSSSLSRTELGEGFETRLLTAEGSATVHNLDNLATGGTLYGTVFPSGNRTQTLADDAGTRNTSFGNGSSVVLQLAPDPRFGMGAPFVAVRDTTVPGGSVSRSATGRAAVLADPTDPFSLVSLTTVSEINGRRYTRVYDARSRRFTTTSPEGRISFQDIDAQGRVIRGEVPGVYPTEFDYDVFGRIAKVRQGTGPGTRETSYEYDTHGRPTSVVDPLGRPTGFEYDLADRLVRQTLPDGLAVEFAWDRSGHLVGVVPSGRTSHGFEYTPVGLESAYIPPPVGGDDSAARFVLDRDRRLTEVRRQDGSTVGFQYDSAGRPTRVDSPEGQTDFAYDASGRLASIAAPGGIGVGFAYLGSFLTGQVWTGPVSGAVSHTLDGDRRVVSETVNGESAVFYGYDQDGLLTTAGDLSVDRDASKGFVTGSHLGQVHDVWEYDGFGQPARHTALLGTTPLYSVQWSRDLLGRVVAKSETLANGSPLNEAYTYDENGRLAEVRRDGVLQTIYTYDDNGNRVGRAVGPIVETAQYDDRDRITRSGDTDFQWNANGELVGRTTGGASTGFSYNSLGNLTEVRLPNETVTYLIDGVNRRVGKAVDGQLTQGFLYADPIHPVAELDGAGQIVSRFVYGQRPNVPDYMVRDGALYRILSDHLGSPRLVVDAATGLIAQRLDYDEFGAVLLDTNPGFQPFGFAGGLYDPDTGLVHFGARDYDPAQGRWLSRDPAGFSGGDANLHVYVLNDPVNLVDPFGLCPDPQWQAHLRGTYAGWGALAGAGVGFVVGGGLGVLTTVFSGGLLAPVAVVEVAGFTGLGAVGGATGGLLLANAVIDVACSGEGDNTRARGSHATPRSRSETNESCVESEKNCADILNDCIEECYPILERPGRGHEWEYRKCLNECMDRNGCGNPWPWAPN